MDDLTNSEQLDKITMSFVHEEEKNKEATTTFGWEIMFQKLGSQTLLLAIWFLAIGYPYGLAWSSFNLET